MATTVMSGERIDYTVTLPHRTKLLILASVLLSLFLSALDQTIVATALPAIVSDLNGLSLVGWISTGYLLASTAMVPIYGKLSDVYGRKAVLIWGILVFLLGSVLCGLAADMVQLIAFRVIQGIGAAALTSTAFAIPGDLFSPAERPRYMGVFGAVFGLASVIGPFLGGLLTDQFSWHWVFYVNLPFGLLALGFVLSKMPRMASGIRAPIDWLGTILLVVCVVPLLLGLTLDKTAYPWGSPLILGLFAGGALALVLFILVERRAASPVLSFDLFRVRTFSVATVASILNGAAFFGAIIFISLFLVNVVGVSATAAGSAQIPLMLAFVASSIASSAIVQRIGRYKPIILTGFVIMLVGFVLLSQITAETTIWDITWRMFILGIGLGPALPLLNLAVQNAVPYTELGAATANRMFFQQLGQAVGAAVFGVILSTLLSAHLATNIPAALANVPADVRATIDVSQFQVGGSTSEASVGERVDFGARLAAAAEAQGAPAAQVAEARAAGDQISHAVRAAFAASIAQIYVIATVLVVVALLLIAVGLPELPLRKTNRPETPIMGD